MLFLHPVHFVAVCFVELRVEVLPLLWDQGRRLWKSLHLRCYTAAGRVYVAIAAAADIDLSIPLEVHETLLW